MKINYLAEAGYSDDFIITIPTKEEYINKCKEKLKECGDVVSDSRIGFIYDTFDENRLVWNECREYFPKNREQDTGKFADSYVEFYTFDKISDRIYRIHLKSLK